MATFGIICERFKDKTFVKVFIKSADVKCPRAESSKT